MAAIKQLDTNLYVSEQLYQQDIESIKQLGIKTIICNRPDDEGGSEQPSHQSIEEALGIEVIYQPITQVSMPEVEVFRQHQQNYPTPILAYCRSGTRSTMLWSAGQILIDGKDRNAIVEYAIKLGFPLEKFLLGH